METELFLRWKEKIPKKGLFVLGCPDGSSAQQLLDAIQPPRAVFLSHDIRAHKSLSSFLSDKTNVQLRFGPWFQAEKNKEPEVCLAYLPKGRETLSMVLHMVADITPASGGQIFLAGHKRGGIASAAKKVEEILAPVAESESARHGKIYRAAWKEPAAIPKPFKDWWQTWEETTCGQELSFRSLPGVFSRARVDPGTLMLLEALRDRQLGGEILDFGCGYGALGTWILKQFPNCEIHMTDSSVLALESCRETLLSNGLKGVTIEPRDLMEEADGPYDWIAANLPFHTGRKMDLHTVDGFLNLAPGKLKPGGKALFVASRFLKIPEMAAAKGIDLGVVTEDRKYRVYQIKG